MQTALRTIVQVSLIDTSGDSFHRMRWPGRHLAEMAPEWRVINLDFRATERFTWGLEADLLVLLHCGDIELLPLIARRRAQGKKTLIEINDNFYAPQAWNPVRKIWATPGMWRMYEKLIDAADGIIVTGPGLYELLKDRAEGKIHILENHFPEDLALFPKDIEATQDPDRLREPLVMGWAGSAGHMADLMYVAPVLREILKENDSIQLHLMGDESIPHFLRAPENRLHFRPFGSIQSYFRFWDPIDIAFVPLLETPYNRCRSDIKAVEIAAKGVLPLLQEGLPYQNFIRETGLPTFRNAGELKQLLLRYVKNRKLLRQEAVRAFHYVKEKRIGSRRTERRELYRQMMEGLPPPSSQWNLAPGFHEIAGQPSASTVAQTLVGEVQGLWNQKKVGDALVSIEREIRKNPDHPDLALLELKCLEAIQSPLLSDQVNHFQGRFPEDLRFRLYHLKVSTDLEARLSQWKDLFALVQQSPLLLRDHFRPAIVNQLGQEPLDDPRVIDLVEIALELFPLAFEFRLKVAYEFEKSGQDALALRHFQWLLQRRREFDEGRSVLDSVPDYVLEVWSAALHARLDVTRTS